MVIATVTDETKLRHFEDITFSASETLELIKRFYFTRNRANTRVRQSQTSSPRAMTLSWQHRCIVLFIPFAWWQHCFDASGVNTYTYTHSHTDISGGSRIVRGGVRFRQGHRDAEVVDGNRVSGRGVPSPTPYEVCGGAVSLSEIFGENTLGILHFVVFSCACKQLRNL